MLYFYYAEVTMKNNKQGNKKNLIKNNLNYTQRFIGKNFATNYLTDTFKKIEEQNSCKFCSFMLNYKQQL